MSTAKGLHLRFFTTNEKVNVVRITELIGSRAEGRRLGISEASIRDLRKKNKSSDKV